MKQRLLLIAIVAMLLITTVPALPATSGFDNSAAPSLGVVYADDSEPTPAPTVTPALPDGSCHGGGQCGD